MKFDILSSTMCPMSILNIELSHSKLEKQGYIFNQYSALSGFDFLKSSDVLLFHPCKLVDKTHYPLDAINKRGYKKIIITACYREEEFNSLNNVEFLSLENLHQTEQQCYEIGTEMWVRIGYGCTHNCSYCPINREEVFSRPIADVLADIHTQNTEDAIIVLSADDCSSYKYDLLDLVEQIPHKVKITYVYPKYFIDNVDRFIDLSPKIHFFTVSVQNLSDRLLGLMSRDDYNSSDLIAAMEKFMSETGRKIDFTHMMVGFPTETEEELLQNQIIYDYFKHVTWMMYKSFPDTESKAVYGNYKDPDLTKKISIITENTPNGQGAPTVVLMDWEHNKERII